MCSADVHFWAERLLRYNNEAGIVQRLVERRPVGMILVDGIQMKQLLIPNPQRCLEARPVAGPKLH